MAIDWSKPIRYKEYAYGKALPVEYGGVGEDGHHYIIAPNSWKIFYRDDGTPIQGWYRPIENYEPEPEKPTMTVDWSKPVQHIDGTPLRVLCTDAPGVYPVIVLTPNGGILKYPLDTTRVNNVPEKCTIYLNVYYEDDYTTVHSSRKKADKEQHDYTRIACVKVEYTVGQFDT